MAERGGIKAGAVGIADQVLLSVANLAVGLILARELDPASFGIYVVAFAVSLVGSSVQLSLVTDPLVILGSPRSGADQSRYFAALVKLQVIIALAVATAVAMIGMALHLAWGASSELPMALLGVAVSVIPVQMQTFFRSVFFARLSPPAAFWNDLIFSALRLAGLAILIANGSLSAFTAFAVWGVAALAASIAAIPQCADLFRSGSDALRPTWAAHWKYGRWLLATSGAYWCSGQAPALLASSLLTPVAAAVIKACQYLVAPLHVAFNGLDGVLSPRASRISASQGRKALGRFLRLFALASGAGVTLYGIVLLPAAPALMEFIYKGRYTGYTAIVGILLLDALLASVSRAPILRLKVRGETQRIFVAYSCAALAGLIGLALLAPAYGVIGAAIAAPVSSAALLACLFRASRIPRGLKSTVGPKAAVVIES